MTQEQTFKTELSQLQSIIQWLSDEADDLETNHGTGDRAFWLHVDTDKICKAGELLDKAHQILSGMNNAMCDERSGWFNAA